MANDTPTLYRNDNVSRESELQRAVENLETARESTLTGHSDAVSTPTQTRKGLNAWITSFIAVGGLLFTVYQFNKTMEAQRHSTAESTVGQFITQITELRTQENLMIASARGTEPDYVLKRPSLLDRLIVSRAQMLIDGDETGKFTGDILRFLAVNEYGSYIGQSPSDAKDVPNLTVDGLVLVNSKLAHATVDGVFLKCMGFEYGLFEDVRFTNGKFHFVFLDNSTLLGVDFSEAWLAAINFSNTEFAGNVTFDNASLLSVDFSDSQFGEHLSFKGAHIINSDMSGIRARNSSDQDKSTEKFNEILSESLAKATSLHGTKLDEGVRIKLKNLVGEQEFNQLMAKPSSPRHNADSIQLQWSWDQECPPQQRRDSRLKSTPRVALSTFKAFF